MLIAMFGFAKEQKPTFSDEIRTYLERITILEQRVTSLELNEQAFRDKVLRKIQYRAVEEEEKPRYATGQKVRR